MCLCLGVAAAHGIQSSDRYSKYIEVNYTASSTVVWVLDATDISTHRVE